MNKFFLVVFQVFFLASFSYAEVTVGRPIGFREAFKSMGKMVQSPPSFSSLSQSLFPVGLMSQIASVIQDGVVKTEEVNEEAKRREEQVKGVLKHEKTFEELLEERKERIKELQGKLSKSRYTLKLNQDQSSEEEMMEELYRLLTEKLEPNFGQEDEESEIAAVESAPGVLEQPAVSGSYVVPGMWMAPGVGSSGFPSISTADEQELLIARCVPSMSEYALKQKSLDELKTDLNDKFEELRKFSCCSSCCPNIAGNRFSRYGLFGRHQTVEGNYYHHTITTYLDDWRFESHAGCGGACLIGVYCFMYHFMVIGIPCAWCDFFNINFSDDKEKYNNLIDETNLINNAIKIKLKTEMK